MTDRLYYHDPYLAEFDANILDARSGPDGQPYVVLDRTAFYPTSGGQPCDTGQLGAARVLDVKEADDGRILHVVDREIAPAPVHGRIDWERRFDHMQQHTGQHVLSAAFDRLFSVRTESFHLGTAASSIDFAREVSAGEIARAEAEANRVVWEDRPVHIRFVTAEEAARLPLRKEPARQGELRVIEIDDFDLSACGGTHVGRTGAIGIIVIAGWERLRGGTRIEFLAGGRALRGYRELRRSMDDSTRLISVLPAELPAGIERLQGEARELKKRVRDLQSRLAAHEAAALAEGAEPFGAVRAVIAALDGWDQEGLKTIAVAIAERPGHVAVLVGSQPPRPVIIARSKELVADASGILRELTNRFGGRGGGRPELAQGGGLDAGTEKVLAFARSLLNAG